MSGQATGWVLRYGPQDRAQRAVLVVIADAANRDGEFSHPGLAALIEGSLYSRSTVLEVLADLRAGGWIEVTQAHSPGRFATYRIPGVLDHPAGRPAAPEEPAHRSENWTCDRSENWTCEEVNRSSPDDQQVQPTGPVNQNMPYIDSTVLTNGFSLSTPSTRDPLAFDRFWEVWPRRHGKRLGRAQAERIWARLKGPDRAAAMAGAAHYASASYAGLAGAMDAHRWLTQRAWVDWQEPAVPDRPGRPPAESATTRAFRLAGFDMDAPA